MYIDIYPLGLLGYPYLDMHIYICPDIYIYIDIDIHVRISISIYRYLYLY